MLLEVIACTCPFCKVPHSRRGLLELVDVLERGSLAAQVPGHRAPSVRRPAAFPRALGGHHRGPVGLLGAAVPAAAAVLAHPLLPVRGRKRPYRLHTRLAGRAAQRVRRRLRVSAHPFLFMLAFSWYLQDNGCIILYIQVPQRNPLAIVKKKFDRPPFLGMVHFDTIIQPCTATCSAATSCHLYSVVNLIS